MSRSSIVLLALFFFTTAPAAQEQLQMMRTTVKTAPVCDTQEFAEQYVTLANTLTDTEVYDKINAGRPKAVCGILTVQFIPERIVEKQLRMRMASVDIVRIRLLAAQLPDLSYVQIFGGITVYIILMPVTPI